MAKGQYTIEFMLSLVTLFFLYALLFPSIQKSLSSAQLEFNGTIQRALIEQISWKAKEVETLEEGAVLSSVIYSPFAFEFVFDESQISVVQGKNEFRFVKTSNGVEMSN